MSYFLFSLLIFLTPFIINPFGGYFFEPPKVIFAEVLIELVLFFYLIKNGFRLNFNKTQLLLTSSLLILTIFHLVLNPSSSIFFGNEFRLQGIFLLWHLVIFSLISSKLEIDNLPKILFPLSFIFLTITSLIVLPDVNGRAIGTLGEANALAATSIFFWPFAFFLKTKFSGKFYKIGIFLLAFIVVLLAGSRSGLLAILLQVMFIFSIKLLGLKKGVILTCFIVIFSLYLPFVKGGGWYENRVEIWKTAIFAGSQNLLGNGFGNIEPSIHKASLELNNNLKYQSVDSAHNFLLDYWIQGGILGIVTILMLIFFSLKGLIKVKKNAEIASFLGIILVMLFNPSSVATLIAFWFILGEGYQD